MHTEATPRWWILILGVSLAALALKIGLLAADAFPFNSDEAIVGLMARHILQGRWPVFFYGQVYMGSLDATLVAGAFGAIGARVIGIRVVQCLLYLGTVATTMLLAQRYLGSKRAAIAAGMLMAIPTVNVTLYSTVSLGGYGEALLLGNLLLLLTLHVKDNPTNGWPYVAWGILAGLGLWAFGLTLVYALPAGVMLGRSLWREPSRRWSKVLGLLGGMLVGAAPWIWSAMLQGIGPLLSELGGSAIAVESNAGPLTGILWRLYNLVIFGSTVAVGLRPPWSISWLALPLAPIALGFWMGVVLHARDGLRKPSKGRALRRLLVRVCALLALSFILTPFGGDPSGRYFLPLAVPMALLGADFLERLYRISGRRLVYVFLALVLVFNLWGTIQALLRSPTGLTTQFDPVAQIDHDYDAELIDFLEQKGEHFGYANYWISYPLAFHSNEEIIFVPRLPYHPDFRYTERDDRYPPYDEIVEASPQVAYITTNHPELDEYLRSSFTDMNIAWSEARIGDYQIFYALSERVSPQEIGLGRTTSQKPNVY
jgi:4-amino-4-deoxy-L-arabinose transferase-like glycosyltransferase